MQHEHCRVAVESLFKTLRRFNILKSKNQLLWSWLIWAEPSIHLGTLHHAIGWQLPTFLKQGNNKQERLLYPGMPSDALGGDCFLEKIFLTTFYFLFLLYRRRILPFKIAEGSFEPFVLIYILMQIKNYFFLIYCILDKKWMSQDRKRLHLARAWFTFLLHPYLHFSRHSISIDIYTVFYILTFSYKWHLHSYYTPIYIPPIRALA